MYVGHRGTGRYLAVRMREGAKSRPAGNDDSEHHGADPEQAEGRPWVHANRRKSGSAPPGRERRTGRGLRLGPVLSGWLAPGDPRLIEWTVEREDVRFRFLCLAQPVVER